MLPTERREIAQELLLFESSGSDDLEMLTDNKLRWARMTLWTPWVDAMLYSDFVERVDADLQEILGDELPFTITGNPAMLMRISKAVIISMARSYAVALLVITPIMILMIGSLRRGLTSMIPNLLPVYLILSLMGWFDLPLDVANMLMGAIVIGLAVDDTIHFMHRFNRYLAETGNPRLAVHRTLATTGAAMLVTSLVLAAGFAVLLTATMAPVACLGLLCGAAAIIAFLADVILAPALLVIVTRPGTQEAAASTRPWIAFSTRT